MPTWLQDALREGGLFAVAVVCLAVTSVFYRMWAGERAYNREMTAESQRQALRTNEVLTKLIDVVDRYADASDSLADQVQRTREEELRDRLDRKGAG